MIKRMIQGLVAGTFAIMAMTAGTAPLSTAQAAQLVLFESKACPTCRQWNRSVAPKYRTTSVGRQLPLRRVQVENGRPADLPYPAVGRVYGVPTFVVVERGREVGRIVGYVNEGSFWRRLRSIVSTRR